MDLKTFETFFFLDEDNKILIISLSQTLDLGSSTDSVVQILNRPLFEMKIFIRSKFKVVKIDMNKIF